MAITTRELARRDFEYLDKEIKRLENKIKLLPEGKLVVYNVNGHRRCYQAYKDPMTNKKVRRYISSRDRTKIQRMIEKTLCVEALIDKKEEYRGLKMYLNVCKNVESRKDRRIAEVPEIREYTDRLTALPSGRGQSFRPIHFQMRWESRACSASRFGQNQKHILHRD